MQFVNPESRCHAESPWVPPRTRRIDRGNPRTVRIHFSQRCVSRIFRKPTRNSRNGGLRVASLSGGSGNPRAAGRLKTESTLAFTLELHPHVKFSALARNLSVPRLTRIHMQVAMSKWPPASLAPSLILSRQSHHTGYQLIGVSSPRIDSSRSGAVEFPNGATFNTPILGQHPHFRPKIGK